MIVVAGPIHQTPNVIVGSNTGDVSVSFSGKGNQTVYAGNISFGAPGKSIYDIWLEEGNTGTLQDFLASIGGVDVSVFDQRVTDLENQEHILFNTLPILN